MKARIHTDEGKLILSIGMIVKNEERFLRDCLSALKPLMDEVPSELIIVDTGSTDKTVDIAKEFTEQVYHFEWCDDFAAARNCGLQKAKGKWFLYIDADEHFAQTKGICDFLKSAQRDNYDLALYTLRNYFDASRIGYADYPARRLFKMYHGIHFQYPIHEGIQPKPTDRLYQIKKEATAYHYGYSDELGEQRKEEKHQRNLKLLTRELEKDPESNHLIVHLVKEHLSHNDKDEAIEFCLKGLELDQKEPSPDTRCYFYNKLMSTYLEQGKTDKVLKTAEEYFACKGGPFTTDLDIYFNRSVQYIRLSDFEKAKEDCESYLERYRAYERKELTTPDIFVDPIVCTQRDFYNRVLSNYAFILAHLGQHEEARQVLEKFESDQVCMQIGDMLYMQTELMIIEKTKDYDRIATLYEKQLAVGDEKRLEALQTSIEQHCDSHRDTGKVISEILAKHFENSDEGYIKLQKARFADTKQDDAVLRSLVEEFLSSKLDISFAEIFYFALKLGVGASMLARAIDFTDIQAYLVKMGQRHSDFSEVGCAYFDGQEAPVDAIEMSFCIALKEQLLLAGEMDEERCGELFESFANYVADYTYSIFVPEVLNEASIQSLPRLYRFGFFMAEAYRCRGENKMADYIKNLRAALSSYEVMKKPIEMLVREFEKQVKEQSEQVEQAKNEFELCASVIKVKIRELIRVKEYAAAKQVIQSLEQLLPGDADIKRYLEECEGK